MKNLFTQKRVVPWWRLWVGGCLLVEAGKQSAWWSVVVGLVGWVLVMGPVAS